MLIHSDVTDAAVFLAEKFVLGSCLLKSKEKRTVFELHFDEIFRHVTEILLQTFMTTLNHQIQVQWLLIPTDSKPLTPVMFDNWHMVVLLH